MGLLEMLKSALGLGSTSEPEPDASSTPEPDASSERAVKEPTEPRAATAPSSRAESPGGAQSDTAESDGSDTEPVTHGDEPAADAETVELPEDGNEHVESISGIGPAYAKRLADAGIDSVAQLAESDADALADETGVSAKRIGRWIERANDR